MNYPVLVATACSIFLAASASAQNLVLTNARIVDPRTRTVAAGAIWVESGRVVGSGPDAPTSAPGPRIDLEGRWIVPAFLDLHTHSFGNTAPGRVSDGGGTAHTAQRVLRAGVVGFLDLFAAEDYIFPLRDRQRLDSTAAAMIFAAGPCFTAPGGHCSEYGIPTRVVRDAAEAREQILLLAARRPDVIKIVYDHHNYAGTPLPTLDRATLRALIESATAQGFRSLVHVGTWEDVRHAVLAGASAITHVGRDGVVPAAVASLVAASGAVYIPTLVVHNDLSTMLDSTNLLNAPLLVALSADTLRATYRRGPQGLDERTRGWIEQQRAAKPAIMESVRRLHSAGVPMLVGTDAGNWGVVQGFSVHRELVRLVEAGLSNWDALAAGTIDAAAFLGRRFGFRPGDEAHFVVLGGSPIEAIENTQLVQLVVKSGRVVVQP